MITNEYEPLSEVPNLLIFRTDIRTKRDFSEVERNLKKLHGVHLCTIDLEDRDKVLRIECENPNIPEIVGTINRHGFNCEELED